MAFLLLSRWRGCQIEALRQAQEAGRNDGPATEAIMRNFFDLLLALIDYLLRRAFCWLVEQVVVLLEELR